jgi:hypothetical protein
MLSKAFEARSDIRPHSDYEIQQCDRFQLHTVSCGFAQRFTSSAADRLLPYSAVTSQRDSAYKTRRVSFRKQMRVTFPKR